MEFLDLTVLQKEPVLIGFTLPVTVVAGEIVGEFEKHTFLSSLSCGSLGSNERIHLINTGREITPKN
jgi:hypothetical protein